MKAPVRHAVSVLTRSLWVRFHMALILLMVFLAGNASSFALLKLGVRSMPARYVLAVLLGYALFLVGVRLWLWYAQEALPHLEREVVEVDAGRRPAALPPARRGSDGSGLADLASASDVLDLGGEGCAAVAIVTIVVVALGGAVAYVLAATPELLGEAVVQFALAAALRRRGKAFKGGHWSGSVFRATWGPALVVVLAAVIIGVLIQAACPSAATIFEAMSICR
jgi:hypothetical protein